MLDILIQFFTDYGYFAVFGMLLLCGFGLPVPEDITLVSGGVISGLGYCNPHVMCFVGLAGVLIGDSIMFLAGRLFGYRIQRVKMFRKILSPRRFSQIQRKFKQYGLGLLFVARFLPGLRSPIYLVSGMSRRVSFPTFLLMDGIAAIISVPVWIYLGYFFADNLDLLMVYVSDVQKAIYLALGLLVVIIVVFYLKKRFHSKLNAMAGEGHDSNKDTNTATSSTASVSASANGASETAVGSGLSDSQGVSAISNCCGECDCGTGSNPAKVAQAVAIKAAAQAAQAAKAAKTASAQSAAQDASAVAQDGKETATTTTATTEATASAQETSSTSETKAETHEEILGKKIKNKKLISKLSKASSLAAAGKGHSQFNPGIGNKSQS